jgi:hypothetical protein
MVDTATKPSAAAPDVIRNHEEDKRGAEKAEEAAMAAKATATQEQRPTVAQHSGGPCSSSTWN